MVEQTNPRLLTQHRKERGELITAINSVAEWRPLRAYGLRLFAAGLPAAVCLWMVGIEARMRIWERADGAAYRRGVLNNQLLRVEGVQFIPEQALVEAIDWIDLEELNEPGP